MKKKFYFATLVIAALSFTGCANDEYVGDQRNLGEQNGAIAFSTKSENTVRADNSVDAGKLNRQFWVYGTKKVGDSDPQPVFQNYRVVYRSGTTSSSNTYGWEYVGQQEESAPAQTIKYWDYSASQYDFEAYSYKTGNGSVQRITEEQVNPELIKDDYKVTQLTSPEHLYFAQKETKSKPTGTQYSDVILTFQSVLSKIRVGFYETIPGYSVKIDKFYKSNADGSDWVATEENNQNFVACCPNKEAKTNHPFVVTYDNEGIPAVTKAAETTDGSYYAFNDNGYTLDAQLTLGTNLRTQNQIGETSSAVTWDNIDNNKKPIYTYFIPQNQLQEGKVQPMKIKVDYTLTSIDGQTNEQIKVKGATAIVPAEYLKWKPNTAYSYVFKISDNTNGTTGSGNDPKGLYPIIFDAAVVDMDMEGSTTTVSTPSVTAKQDGTTAGYVIPDGIVFKTKVPIDLKVMNGDTEDNGATITGGYITGTYDYGKTPEQNLTDGSGSFENIATLPGEKKLAAKESEGYWVLKVTAGSSTTYVIIRVGKAEEGPANSEQGPANS